MPKLGRRKMRALAALALFNFTFLGSEFHYDIEVGGLVGSAGVVAAQGVILGASVVGFLGYAPSAKLFRGQMGRLYAALVGAAAAGCLASIRLIGDAATAQVAGATCFLMLGCMGAAAHAVFSRAFAGEEGVAKGAGCAYAAGLLLQFVNNMLVPQGAAEVAVLCLGMAALVACLVRAGAADGTAAEQPLVSESRDRKPAPLPQALWSVALVAILACTFSTLDGVVTIANADGTYAVQTWPRLFLAASGLVSGAALNARGGRYAGPIMFCVALLSVLSILAVEAGASPLIGLVVFYLGSGCFVVFFTSLFVSLAPRMGAPELWAGMGRATNNLCAFAIAGASMAVVGMGAVAVMIASVLLVVAAGLAFLQAGLLRLPGDETSGVTAGPSLEERRQAFIETAGLTPRETDVLLAVTQDDRPLKQIASDLGISLRMVQRHLTSIYAKTGTQSRSGLASKFPR